MEKPEGNQLRCAIYTRKSSEEGLEQSFNSLDAQREACEAYAKSQAHEGWFVLEDAYDDGGFSGGNLERPALVRLLADIEAGKVDIVIVYKVDRLSRSLADFVRLVELFDKTEVSFVSVTQQFNTSTSMGRLTLNVLLSFAQFEREVTSERIRDKIAASKKKGMWMGGLVPLGYDRVDKQLVVNEKEATLVRHIYTRYLATGCVRDLKAELDADGYHSKPRPAHHQSPGGKPFSRGALYTILKNPAYVGKVHHQGELHEGRHAAILDAELWEAVQERLTRNRLENRRRANARYPSLLAGLIYDDRGNRMSPSSSHKQNRRYAYYVSQAVIQFRENEAGSLIRVSTKIVDQTVVDLLLGLLGSADQLLDALRYFNAKGDTLERAIEASKGLVEGWSRLTLRDQIPIVQQLLNQVVVGRSEISVALDLDELYRLLTGEDPPAQSKSKRRPVDLVLKAPVILKRSGIETKLVYPGGPPPKAHKRTVKALQEALLKSMQWNEAILSGDVPSFEALIRRDDLNPRQTHRLRKLAFLAPDIIEAIILGQIPETLSLEVLKRDFPSAWDAQRRHFGFH
jgi:DNA invertase Pin-like site-specific DNA recombinase